MATGRPVDELIEEIYKKLAFLLKEIKTPTSISTQENQDLILAELENLVELTKGDDKGYSLNPKIDENPQELLRLIHGGIDILIEQQIITNNLLKLILS